MTCHFCGDEKCVGHDQMPDDEDFCSCECTCGEEFCTCECDC